jgi:hypothetical protein
MHILRQGTNHRVFGARLIALLPWSVVVCGRIRPFLLPTHHITLGERVVIDVIAFHRGEAHEGAGTACEARLHVRYPVPFFPSDSQHGQAFYLPQVIRPVSRVPAMDDLMTGMWSESSDSNTLCHGTKAANQQFSAVTTLHPQPAYRNLTLDKSCGASQAVAETYPAYLSPRSEVSATGTPFWC